MVCDLATEMTEVGPIQDNNGYGPRVTNRFLLCVYIGIITPEILTHFNFLLWYDQGKVLIVRMVSSDWSNKMGFNDSEPPSFLLVLFLAVFLAMSCSQSQSMVDGSDGEPEKTDDGTDSETNYHDDGGEQHEEEPIFVEEEECQQTEVYGDDPETSIPECFRYTNTCNVPDGWITYTAEEDCIGPCRRCVDIDDPLYGRYEMDVKNNNCVSNDDCFTSGCSNEVCAAEGVGTTCEELPGPKCFHCGCLDGECLWLIGDCPL